MFASLRAKFSRSPPTVQTGGLQFGKSGARNLSKSNSEEKSNSPDFFESAATGNGFSSCRLQPLPKNSIEFEREIEKLMQEIRVLETTKPIEGEFKTMEFKESESLVAASSAQRPRPPSIPSIGSSDCEFCGDSVVLFSEIYRSEFPLEFRYFICSGDIDSVSHVSCSDCFSAYISHCCSNLADEKFPIRCPLKECNKLIQESEIKRISKLIENESQSAAISSNGVPMLTPGSPSVDSLWSRYERCAVQSGIMDACKKEKNCEIECTKCRKFRVLLPADYKERANRLVVQMAADVEAEAIKERQAIFQSLQQKLQSPPVAVSNSELMGELKVWLNSNVSIGQNSFDLASQPLRTTSIPQNLILTPSVIGDAAPPAPYLPFYTEIATRAALRSTSEIDSNRNLVKQLVQEASNTAIGIVDEPAEEEEKKAESNLLAADSDELPSVMPLSIVRQESVGMLTSLFVSCETPDCGFHHCLRCDATLSSTELSGHICKSDSIEQLYEELCNLLTHAITRQCPGCSIRATKNPNCCHITCTACSEVWCFYCGKKRSELVGGDFTVHNQWTFDCDDSLHCPIYMQYVYGNCATMYNRFYEGDAEKSLIRFGIDKQRQAYRDWRATFADSPAKLADIDDMIKIKFPFGIWDEAELLNLEECELIRNIWRNEKSDTIRSQLVAELRAASAVKRAEINAKNEQQRLKNRADAAAAAAIRKSSPAKSQLRPPTPSRPDSAKGSKLSPRFAVPTAASQSRSRVLDLAAPAIRQADIKLRELKRRYLELLTKKASLEKAKNDELSPLQPTSASKSSKSKRSANGLKPILTSARQNSLNNSSRRSEDSPNSGIFID